jgi:hypothetical protein
MRRIIIVTLTALPLAYSPFRSFAGEGALSPAEATQVRTAITHCQEIAANPNTYGTLPDSCVDLLQLFHAVKRAAGQ